jgi:transcription antitermination factor NusG
MTVNHNGSPRCLVTCQPPKKPRTDDESRDWRWFVLEVTPGKEDRVKRDVWRRLRRFDLDHAVKQLLIPTQLAERLTHKAGRVLDSGVAPARGDAVRAGRDAARLVAGYDGKPAPDGASGTPGVRIRTIPEVSERKDEDGKARKVPTGRWKWDVVEVLPDRNREVVRQKKYPGYILFHGVYSADLEKVVAKVRHTGGFLLPPVVRNHLAQVSKSLKGGYIWRVRDPESGEIVVKGRAPDEGRAKAAADAAKAELEKFTPSFLADQESAELLVRQRAVDQIAKDPAEKNRAVLNFKPGDEVAVTGGPFKGLAATVKAVDKSDKANPHVTAELTIMGTKVAVRVEWYDISPIKLLNGRRKK